MPIQLKKPGEHTCATASSWSRMRRHMAAITLLCVAMMGTALEAQDFAGTARGFPALRDRNGKKLAAGDFAQWLENERLHIKVVYQFSGGRRVEEKTVMRAGPQPLQEQWSWHELRDGQIFRHFELNTRTGKATAQKREEKGLSRWSEDVEIEPGRAFAGIGFVFAIQSLRERLTKGEKIELQAVGFTPKPRKAAVEISYQGLEEMRMADRVLKGEHFIIHPKIPKIADLFIDAPDTHVWLTHPPPAAFLRVEGPLVEPGDPLIRIDLLPGGRSGPARPVKKSSRPQE